LGTDAQHGRVLMLAASRVSKSQRVLADVLTCCNLVSGIAATLLSGQGRPVRRSTLILLAAVCDALDGPLARRSGCATELGAATDGVADLISFGVAPATLLANSASCTAASTLASGLYTAAAAWRLARYGSRPRTSHIFRGLPLTGAGIVLTTGLHARVPPSVSSCLALALALAMVSGVPVPSGEELVHRVVMIRVRGCC
jgi:CDP-diacylglycerol--serine O-phosphatidyltransferase